MAEEYWALAVSGIPGGSCSCPWERDAYGSSVEESPHVIKALIFLGRDRGYVLGSWRLGFSVTHGRFKLGHSSSSSIIGDRTK